MTAWGKFVFPEIAMISLQFMTHNLSAVETIKLQLQSLNCLKFSSECWDLLEFLLVYVGVLWGRRLYVYNNHHMTRNARWRSRRPRYKAAFHVPNFDSPFPAPELSLADSRNNPFWNMTTHCIGSDSIGAGTRESKSDTCTAALLRDFRLHHLAFLVICTNLEEILTIQYRL